MNGSYTGYYAQRARESAREQIEREKWQDTQVGYWPNKPIYQMRETSVNAFEVYIRYVSKEGKIVEETKPNDTWKYLSYAEAERLITALSERATQFWRGKKYVTPMAYQEKGIKLWD